MRVISQDGTIDVPYERYTIWCYKDQYLDIYHIACDCGDEVYRRLAEYSTEAKAIKAMEMLREHHEKVAFLKTIINTETGASFVRGLSENDFDKMTRNYFQFPKD